jgi:hypothetical protein
MWLGVNWQTSAAGIGQILGSLAGIAIGYATGGVSGLIAGIVAAMSAIPGAIGLINAKDANVTGGTVPATKESVARTTPVASMPVAGL